MNIVHRIDYAGGEVSAPRRTSIGGVRARANLTRTGVFVYRNADGSTRREYRPPEEVFNKDSLASLAHVPITVGHPTKVTPDSWSQLAKGHVGESPQRAGKFASTDIHVEDASAASDVEAEKLKELSCGYTCHLEPTPGTTPDGEAYDGIQRRIRYNHVALLPAGTGRAGPEVRLHLDEDATNVEIGVLARRQDEGESEPPGPIEDARKKFEDKQSTRYKDTMRRGRDSRGSAASAPDRNAAQRGDDAAPSTGNAIEDARFAMENRQRERATASRRDVAAEPGVESAELEPRGAGAKMDGAREAFEARQRNRFKGSRNGSGT